MIEIDTERQEKLLKKATRANTGLRVTAISAMVVLFLTLGFLVAQGLSLQHQLDAQLKSQQDAALRNHTRTQQYVRCIANVLMKPLKDRTEADFDECGIQGTSNSNAQQSVSPKATERSTPQAPVQPVPVVEAPKIEPVTEDAKQEVVPEPEEKSDKAILGVPLVDNLLRVLLNP